MITGFETCSFTLTYMVVATGVIWVPVTLLTKPETDATLMEFYRRVRPPGPGWARIRAMVPEAAPAPLGSSARDVAFGKRPAVFRASPWGSDRACWEALGWESGWCWCRWAC